MEPAEGGGNGRVRNALLILVVCLTLPWLWFSAQYALGSGWDSDIIRQWVSAQYLRAGTSPYRVAHEALFNEFGTTHGPDRVRLDTFKIYQVSPNLSLKGIEGGIPELGPPTATYQPSSLLPLAYTVGLLPEASVLPIWLAVNLALMVGLMAALAHTTFRPRLSAASAFLVAAALTLVWPPTHEVYRTSQFVFLIMLLCIAGFAVLPRSDWRAGLWFSFGLIKPSLFLPFLIIPFVRGRWRVFVTMAALHVPATLIVWGLVGEPPWVMWHHWIESSRYMLQGAYSIQEIVNRLGVENTTLGTVITLGFVGLCVLWSLVHRHAGNRTMITMMCFVSVLWTYHERYDFALLLIPIAYTVDALFLSGKKNRTALLFAVGYLVLGFALSDLAYIQEGSVVRMVRWGGRLALAGMFALAAWDVRSDHRRSVS